MCSGGDTDIEPRIGKKPSKFSSGKILRLPPIGQNGGERWETGYALTFGLRVAVHVCDRTTQVKSEQIHGAVDKNCIQDKTSGLEIIDRAAKTAH